MPSALSTVLAGFVGIQTAFAVAVAPRAAPQQYSTLTRTITLTSTTVVEAATTIATDVTATGVATLIPGALTLTFNNLPAYFYLETTLPTTSTVITYSTTKVKIPVSSTKAATTPAIVSSTSKTSTKTPSTTAGSSTVKPSSTSTKPSTTTPTTPALNAALSKCAEEGVNNGMTVWSTSPSSDFLSCYWGCGSTTQCYSISFNTLTSTCTFYTPASASHKTSSTSNEFFTGKHSGADTCYQSATATSTPTALPPAQTSALNICYTEARDTGSSVISSSTSPDILSCSKVCDANSDCLSYSYSYNNDNLCTIYSSYPSITEYSSRVWYAVKGNGAEDCYVGQYPAATSTSKAPTAATATSKKVSSTSTSVKATASATAKKTS